MGPEIHDGREAKIVVKRLWVEIGMLKAILLEGSETWRDILFLREYKNYINRMLVELWMLKSNLVVSDGNEEHILEAGGKVIFVAEVVENLAELHLCSTVLWKVEPVNIMCSGGIFLSKLSKRVVCVLLTTCNNMVKDTDELKEGIAKSKGTRLED